MAIGAHQVPRTAFVQRRMFSTVTMSASGVQRHAAASAATTTAMAISLPQAGPRLPFLGMTCLCSSFGARIHRGCRCPARRRAESLTVNPDRVFYARAFTLAAFALLAYLLWLILGPFLRPIAWALFIAFVIYPLQ